MLAAALAGSLIVLLAGCGSPAVPAAPVAKPAPAASPSMSATPAPTVTPSPTPTFNSAALSITDPASLWVVVDKLRPLVPANYIPGDLVQTPLPHQNVPTLRGEASTAMVAMFAAGAAEGAGAMTLQSAYRSNVVQVSVYNGYVASAGKAGADAQSARPGFSEHQTGLAADIAAIPAKCTLAACFGQTSQGIWLAANAWRFGYLLRYPADKIAITGYIYEPWHFRYIGVALSTEMHNRGVTTLEEFFGLPAAPNYAP
jgi:D-alanyl-D-alanine carboxypeptidase